MKPSNQPLTGLQKAAILLVLPGEEDFGIAPVEALACGCPVVALARGGATETVDHGVTQVEMTSVGVRKVGYRHFALAGPLFAGLVDLRKRLQQRKCAQLQRI